MDTRESYPAIPVPHDLGNAYARSLVWNGHR